MKAVLDANVLYPTILREILIEAAASGLFQPVWSDRILGEWSRAADKLGPHHAAGAEIALLNLRFPSARTSDDGTAAIDLNFPDPADRHVVETALAAAAPWIVTANLRDFPRGMMASLGLRALHPDAFLLGLWQDAGDKVAKAVQMARDKAANQGGEMSVAQMLKRSRLPRLAKALRG